MWCWAPPPVTFEAVGQKKKKLMIRASGHSGSSNHHFLKGGCSVWVKKPAFLFHLFVYEVQESEFCMSVYHYIRQLVVQEFFPRRSDFPGK